MRIQHNIMAMSAYRNYNNNTSAVAKNLEKLSSGYKINRAGDDAAGLAISEKMRAQITGLNAAQKNVKDGISLVKTAEGAMQEIQDMLNRMDYLATQSANGTYDDAVDRAALQKEVDQLRTEINRIASSANFNGIKLLDGSLDGSAKAAVEASESTAAGMLPSVGQVLGKDTVLHQEAGTAAAATSMSVDLHDLSVDGIKGQTFKITIGDAELTGTLAADATGNNALTAADIAAALAGDVSKITFTDKDGNAYNKDAVVLGGGTFKASAAANGTRVTFTQDDDVDVNPEMKVSVTAGTAKAADVATATTTAGTDAVGKTAGKYTSNATIAQVTLAEAKAGNTYNVTLGGKEIEVTSAAGDGREELLTKWAAAFSEAGFTVDITGDDLVVTATGKTGATVAEEGDFTALGFAPGGTVNDDGTDTTYTITDAVKNFKAATDNTGIADSADTNEYTVAIDGKSYDLQVGLDSTKADVGQAWVDAYADDAANTKFDAAMGTGDTIVLTAKELGTDATSGTAEADTGMTGGTWAAGTDDAATSATTVIDFTGKTGKDVIGGRITVGDATYEFVKDAADADAANKAVVVAENATAAQIAAALNTAATADTPTGVTSAYTATETKVTFTADNAGEAASDDVEATVGQAGGDPKLTGDWNVSTTNIEKKGEAAGKRLASTYFDLSKAMAANGNEITIGKETYTFTTDEAKKADAGMVYVGDLDLSKAEDLAEAADRLTKAAANNQTYTVGHDGKRLTFTENDGQTEFAGDEALTSYENIEKSFGFKTAAQAAVPADDSKSLSLQIGDTSESFNQMKVSVGDMHTNAMGTGSYVDENGNTVQVTKTIADIDIGNQAGAAEAINVIKNAINYVSGVRGDLGAIQNRLEHTANNLSVMAENIQDAESTIRDTDVAEEMMSYTKNNILVQSAQAMLAQANQVPQGVLQLLG